MKKWIFLLGVFTVLGFSSILEAKPNYNEPLELNGVLVRTGDDYYVEGMELEFGDDDYVAGDFDGDGRSLPIELEMYGLVGKQITIKGFRDIDAEDYDEIHVTEINGKAYLNPKIRR